MDLVFDSAEHKEFADYIIANQKIFDKIEAQYMASKASGDQSGNITQFHLLHIINHIYSWV